MNYTVVWQPAVERRLTELWLAASDRDGVRRAADQLDARLGRDPSNEGESREKNFRLAFESPLAVKYLLREADRLVLIVRVWTF